MCGMLAARAGAVPSRSSDVAAPLRTGEAHLFFVPIYLSSVFMWPIVKFADQPYYGADENAPRHRAHQATLLMLRALKYIQRLPFWRRRGGKDHIWMMLHDEGPCFCPREIRSSILLTHYGYHAAEPKPWGTFFDDNFLADRRFYERHLSATPVKRGSSVRYPPLRCAPCPPSYGHARAGTIIQKDNSLDSRSHFQCD
jgi:hypothetical protein